MDVVSVLYLPHFSLPIVPSEPPIRVEGTSDESTSIKVSWQPPPARAHNGHLLGFKVYYARNDSNTSPDTWQFMETDASDRSIIISDLEKFTAYRIGVRAYTQVGDSPMSAVIVRRTDEDGRFNICQYEMSSGIIMLVK